LKTFSGHGVLTMTQQQMSWEIKSIHSKTEGELWTHTAQLLSC